MTHDLTIDQDDERARRRVSQPAAEPRHDAGGTYEDASDQTAHADHRHQGRNRSVSPSILQQMQQTHGNRAVRRFLQRTPSSSAAPQDDDIAHRIQKEAGGGSALEASVQHKLERGLGADLSGVRVHTGSEADEMARSVASVAFTSGQDIFFQEGAYNPSSQDGMRLLAHEATHTVQQARGPVAGTPSQGGVSISDPSDEYERAADTAAGRLTAGFPTPAMAQSGGSAVSSVQRESSPPEEAVQSVQRQASPQEEDEPVQREANQEDEEQQAASRANIPVLSPSNYEIKPVTEGVHSGALYLVDRTTHDEWLFTADNGRIARELAEQGRVAPGGISEEHPPGFRLEVAELNGQAGTLLDWTRKDDTLADIRNRDPQLFSDLLSSPLKTDVELISALVSPLDQHPENLRVNIDPATKTISKLEALDANTAFPPGPLRDAILPFMKPGGGGRAEMTGEMVSALQRLVASKESVRRVMEAFFGEDMARRILVGLDAALVEATEASKKARK